jgi:dTDP-4-dehydrorhamnose reductase
VPFAISSASTDVLVLGASGLVGSALVQQWANRYEISAPSHGELDVLDAAALEAYLRQTSAETVVNLAAWADVDGAERERGDSGGLVHRLNVDYPGRLAELCARYAKHLIHVSTDYVFDGTKTDAPYEEQEETRGVCWYAETKLRGEQAVLLLNEAACVARIEMPFTARRHRKSDLARTITNRLQHGHTVVGVVDQRITPVFLDDAATALAELVRRRPSGIIHIAAADWTTPYDLACSLARRLNLPEDHIQPQSFERFSSTRPARRPQHSWLDVTKFTRVSGPGILRPVEDELDRWAAQWQSN